MLNKSIYETELIVLDIETTGISPEKGARIVEIAAIKIKKGLKLDTKNTFHSLINPLVPIPYSAYRVHRISDDLVKNAPTFEEVFPEFLSFADTPVIVGQNISFDYRFLQHHAQKHQYNFKDNILIDTINLTKRIAPNLKRYNLDSLIQYFGIEHILEVDHRHRATFDVFSTAIIFIKSIEILERLNSDLKIIDLI